MYVQRNIKTHSCNRCCHGEEIRVRPITGHEGEELELRYSSPLSLTSALSGGRQSTLRPGRTLPPGKIRYPLYRRLGGSRGQFGGCGKSLPPLGFDPRSVRPVASRYTDCVIAAHMVKKYVLHILSLCLQPLVSSMKCACAILIVFCGLSGSTIFSYVIS